MTNTPTNVKQQCLSWETGAFSLLVFLAVYAIISHAYDLGYIKESVLSLGATCCVMWSVWVVRTFRNIMIWWIDIQHKVDGACNLLSETKQEIKELKLIKQGK
jgi:hypothetical protein